MHPFDVENFGGQTFLGKNLGKNYWGRIFGEEFFLGGGGGITVWETLLGKLFGGEKLGNIF